MRDEVEDYTVSDDEQLVAFNYMYDNFLVPAKGGEAKAHHLDHSGRANIRFLDDKTMLIVKTEGGIDRLFQAEVSPEIELKPVKWFGADSLNVEAIRKIVKAGWNCFIRIIKIATRSRWQIKAPRSSNLSRCPACSPQV